MMFMNRFFLLLTIVFGAFVQTIAAVAADIPGYIGSQSFRLQDDPELNSFDRRAEEAKIELARADESRAQIENQARILERDIQQIKGKMETLAREVETLQGLKKQTMVKLEELKKAPEANAEAIKVTEQELASYEQAIVEKNKQAGALKMETAPLNVRLDQVRNDLVYASKRAEDARFRLQNANRQLVEYRQELISSLQYINREGARVGQNDGSNDGALLSRKLGHDRGSRDGQTDGHNEGTVAGQDRYYQRGAEQGERDGAARARIDGQRDGTAEGIVSGNRSAGAREGRAAGYARAQKSDAAAVGTTQGKKAGMERAISTGQVDGRNIGESETTKKLESGELTQKLLNGAFAGSFSRRTPEYPGDFNGQSYNPNVYNSKEILRKAYADGYVHNYRQFTRYEFLRRIDSDYNQSYDQGHREAYNTAVNREYPAHYDQGRRDADARAYSRDYPLVKGEAFKVAFDRLNASPDRSSNEFKTSYKNSELSAYNELYEEIRSENFDRHEAEVFGANIAAQTEIYRQKRIAEVTSIYNGNAVLKFVSSEMLDGGISGVAGLDQVFQPGERTVHSVVLKNFGFKEAVNVSVQVDAGTSVKIPAIPARSQVTIVGAVEAKVTAGLGAVHKSSLQVVSPLQTKDAVEGRHFDRLQGGVLKEADQKSVRVSFPIALAGMSLNSQLLKGERNKLKLTLTNNSKRAYKGELKIKLVTNSQTGIIAKDFADLAALEGSVSLSDAEVLVTSEDDVYRDLAISASIEQNGVKIGELSQDFITMAKAQFFDKAGLPVLVANSETHLRELLDALSNIGGTDKVAVLDLSLASLNAAVLSNGLSQKVLLIVDDASATSLKTLNGFIGKSKSSSFVFIDEESAGLKNVLSMGALKDATKLSLDKRAVVFSNPHRAAGVVKSSIFIQSGLKNFMNDLELAQELTLAAPEMLADIKAKVSPASFASPIRTLKIYSLKALAEVLNINAAYDGSGGIFNRDKKWPEMLENDMSLFMNQLRQASKGEVVQSRLPHVLAALAMKDVLSNAMSYSDEISREMKMKIRSTTNGVLDDMEDDFKKSLKKNFKEIYNKAYVQAQMHRPFFIDPPPTPSVGN